MQWAPWAHLSSGSFPVPSLLCSLGCYSLCVGDSNSGKLSLLQTLGVGQKVRREASCLATIPRATSPTSFPSYRCPRSPGKTNGEMVQVGRGWGRRAKDASPSPSATGCSEATPEPRPLPHLDGSFSHLRLHHPAPGKPGDFSDTGPQTCRPGTGPLGGGGQDGVEGTLRPSGTHQPPLLESLGESLAPGPLTGVFFYIY